MLYAYPILQTVEEDYKAHIQNKAILSYKSDKPAEVLMEYIAGEIEEKRKLEWLKDCIQRALEKLSNVEQLLVAVKYFGKNHPKKQPLAQWHENEKYFVWSERKYFRMQNRIIGKISGLLRIEGLTEELFKKEYETMDIFHKIHNYIQSGKDKGISSREKRWLRI